MSALTLYKHTCHFCEAAERAALRVFNVMEDFLARIQTANKAAAMAAHGDNDQAKAPLLQRLTPHPKTSTLSRLPQLRQSIFFIK